MGLRGWNPGEKRTTEATNGPCAHCWHSTGLVLTSLPPQYPEVCCRCGERRTRRGSTPNPVMHGPYLPGQTVGNVQEARQKITVSQDGRLVLSDLDLPPRVEQMGGR